MKDLYTAIGRRIREIRQAKSMTIQALAESISIDPSFLGQVERGVGIPSLKTLNRLSEAMDISLKDLFEFDERQIASSDFLVREVHHLLRKRPKKDRARAIRILKEVL